MSHDPFFEMTLNDDYKWFFIPKLNFGMEKITEKDTIFVEFFPVLNRGTESAIIFMMFRERVLLNNNYVCDPILQPIFWWSRWRWL